MSYCQHCADLQLSLDAEVKMLDLVAKERDGARRTAEYWKAEHNAATAYAERLATALRFYAEPKRYHGPNQSIPECFRDDYQPGGGVYLLDVTRDAGQIAREALAKGVVQNNGQASEEPGRDAPQAAARDAEAPGARGSTPQVSAGSSPDRPAIPPYPFCSHPEKCIPTGQCERRVNGELQCCAD